MASEKIYCSDGLPGELTQIDPRFYLTVIQKKEEKKTENIVARVKLS